MASWRAVIDIPASTVGPATARAVVRGALIGWRLDELVTDAVLVVSELVTNAYRHAPGADTFELEITGSGGQVLLAVTDGSSLAAFVTAMSERSAGHGMQLVRALVSAWGVEEHGDGKRVWVTIDRPV